MGHSTHTYTHIHTHTLSLSLRNCSSANYFQPLATLQDNNDLPGKDIDVERGEPQRVVGRSGQRRTPHRPIHTDPRSNNVNTNFNSSTAEWQNTHVRNSPCRGLPSPGSLGPLNLLGGTLELAGCPMMLVLSRIQFLIGRSHPLVECLTEQRMNLGPGLSGVSGLCSASAGLVLGENAF